MTGVPEGPGSRLAALTELPAPATTIDVYKACSDGYRLRLRRRRTSTLLTGTAVVVGVAATVLTAAHSSAGNSAGRQAVPGARATSPASIGAAGSPSATPSAPGLDSAPAGVRVPVRFGWLPQGMAFISEGPAGGKAAYTAAAGTTTGKAVGQPRVFLTVADIPPATTSQSAVEGLGTIAYWATDNGQTAEPGMADLVWHDASGMWLTLSGDHLDPGTAAATLVHIAQTVVVGDVPLPLPIQIRGLPTTAPMSLDQAVLNRPASGHSGPTDLNVGLTIAADGVNVFVKPVGTVQGPWTWGVSACKDSNGWNICVVAGPKAAAELPGGINGVLAHIQGLGTDPAYWSAQFFAP